MKKGKPELICPRCVHGQDLNGRATDGGPADEVRADKLKVLVPEIGARVKQAHQCTRLGIKPSGVRTLVPIAVRTSQREIVLCRLPVVLTSADVIDLKAQRKDGLREAAIFAAVLRTRANEAG